MSLLLWSMSFKTRVKQIALGIQPYAGDATNTCLRSVTIGRASTALLGADLAVMTNFEAQFGKERRPRLETTFRCPRIAAVISDGGFVQKNPRQLQKKVRSY